ncbi:hypothetical protein Pint_30194 [Pistacia integerrima]|uniref:Uncharacterized protein n=1 Tax=Pistacia integerrima TaxID=434235 RepID=A0ACC0WZF0_9ROSI|nr:hypothetical protein Pint_30194 [Pistacia integerrima]
MSDSVSNPPKFHFVLVHGSSHGGWCWFKIRCLMETSGYKVTCVDLKSAGIDPSDPNTLFTFAEYNKPLIEFLFNLPEDEKVILVGHSAGGLSLTDALHKFGSKKIQMAIYVAANMLKYGFNTDEDVKEVSFIAVPDLSEFADVNEQTFGLGPDKPPTSMIVKKEFQRKILYNMSPMEDSTLASMLLKPAPAMALGDAKFEEQGSDADKVRRVYIKTSNDRVIKQEQQDAMIRSWLPSEIFDIESDHSPFFSAPFIVFGSIIKAAVTLVE